MKVASMLLPAAYLGLAFVCFALPACDKKQDLSQPATNADHKKSRREGASEPAAYPRPDEKALLSKLKSPDLRDPRGLDGEIKGLVSHDHKAALSLVDQLPPGKNRLAALREVIANFPPDRTPELVAWADASAYREDRSLLLSALAPDRTNMTRDEAVALLGNMKTQETKEALVTFAALATVDGDYLTTRQAREFATDLPEGNQQDFMREFLGRLTAVDPLKGVAEAIDSPDDYSNATRQACLTQAGVCSPAKASEIVLSAFRRSGDASIVVPFVEGWLQSDSMAAGQWVSLNLSGESRDRAAAEIVKFLIAQGDLEGSKAWRDSITSSEIKERLPEE